MRAEVFMDFCDSLKPGGSSILPEETAPKFFARHLSAYYFATSYVRGKDVLEVGFGDGYGADFLAGHAKSVTAIDVLEQNVRLAQAKYKKPNLGFRQMDATNLYFEDDSFDVILSFQVIEHIPEDSLDKYLRGIKRILKKGGLAFISTLNLEKNKKPNRPYNKNPFHIKEFTYEEFEALIKKAFDRCEIHGLFYGKRLKFYEHLKKSGVFTHLPRPFNIVDKFYNNITVRDFIWSENNLAQCIDFMAKCIK